MPRKVKSEEPEKRASPTTKTRPAKTVEIPEPAKTLKAKSSTAEKVKTKATPKKTKLLRVSADEPAKPERAARITPAKPKKLSAHEAASPSKETRSKRPQRVQGKSASTADELPVPVWRPAPIGSKQRGQKEIAQTKSPVPAPHEETSLAPRRSRDRRRKDLRVTEITAAAALEPSWRKVGASASPVEGRERPIKGRGRRDRTEKYERTALVEAPTQPIAPATPTRERIPIPDDAPQVVLRNGVPTLVREGRVYPPLMFFGSSPTEENVRTVFEEIKLACARGVHLFGHLVDLEVNPDKVDEAVGLAGYFLKQTLTIDSEAQVFFRVVFTAPRGWEERYPKARFVAESGGVAEPSFSDDLFWDDAQKCLEDFVVRLRLLDDADQILGIHLERGEWFFADGWGYDTSIAAQEKFRQWARVRYREDVVSLRAAWFDGQATFDSIEIPKYKRDIVPGEEFVRTGRKARRWVDYHLFLSDATVERIAKLAYATKKASDGYFLVGASYGYTFEWSHPASGHLSLGKLLRTPEVDFIAGPPSYKNREPGSSAPFPGPIDSFAINGKLYISEEDFKTPISGKPEPDDFNPVMRTPQALESVHWRGIGAALAHQSGVCWMDLWGNGWLQTSTIWNRAEQAIDALIQKMAAPVDEPDVAVFIDERSLAYLVDQEAFRLLVQNVRESVLRSGLSVGFYLLSDLAHRERFPESKLYVFMNAWDIRPEVRSAIKGRLQRDGKVLFWLYAAGLFDGGRDSLERVREVTGIALKPQPFASKPGTTMLNRRNPLCEALPDTVLATGSPLEPSYFAIPEEGAVLGEYTQTGLPSYVIKEFTTEGKPELSWTSVFFGEPIVTPALFRALGQLAGAHIWNFQDDVVHARAPFFAIHASGAGPRTITLPDKWSAYNLITKEWMGEDTTHVRFTAIDGATHLFLVGLKEEIDGLISIDPEQWLRMEELPERPDDTLHLDSALLDVPIMKLDEWIEESWNEESVDDLLLKPSQLEIEEPEPVEEARSRRRTTRKRRGRDDRGGSEETASARREGADTFGDLGMNVIFRKRE